MPKQKLTLTITVIATKADGPPQDDDAVRQAVEEAIDGIGVVYVQDGEHDDESGYEIATEWIKPENLTGMKPAAS